jgi:predicted RNA-binding protein with PIN domain
VSSATEHLIVDGMNVIGSRPDGWWRDRDGAARRLLGRLQQLARAQGTQVTLVLDGRPLGDVPAGRHDGVEVTYARRAGRDAGDDRLVEVLDGLADRSSVSVVTSDRGLAARVEQLSVPVFGARRLLDRLDALDR